MEQSQDRTIVCRESTCQKEFTFSAGEQEYYANRGLNPPARCKQCRDRRKAEQNAQQVTPGPTTPSVAVTKTERFAPADNVEIQHRKPFGSRKESKRNRKHFDEDYES